MKALPNLQRKIKKRWIAYFSVFPILFMMGAAGYNDDIIPYIEVQQWGSDIIRNLGWAILTGLAKFLDGLYNAITTLITLDFVNDIPAVKQFTDSITPLAWAILSFCLIGGAILLMVLPDKVKISEFTRSIILSILMIVALPTAIQTFNDFKTAGVDDMTFQMTGGEENDTVGKTLLRSVTVDVNASQSGLTHLSTSTDPYALKASDTLANKEPWTRKVVSINSIDPKSRAADRAALTVYGMSQQQLDYFKETRPSKADLVKTLNKNSPLNVDEEKFLGIFTDPTAVLAQYDYLYSTYYSKYLDEKMSGNGSNYAFPLLKKVSIDVLDSSTWFQSDEFLYAYQPNFFNGFVILLVSIVAVAFAGFKIAKLLFDLAFNQILLPVVIASDLHNSGRAKKFIQSMVSTYVIFIILLLLIKIYLDISTWAAQTTFDANSDVTNLVIRILILAGSAMGLIDGPDLVARVIGIDAGIKYGMGAMVGAMGVARFAKSAAHAVSAPFRGAAGFIRNSNPISALATQAHARQMNNEDVKDRWKALEKKNNPSGGNALDSAVDSSSGSTSLPENSSSTIQAPNSDNTFANNPIAQREQSMANAYRPPASAAHNGSGTASNPVAQRESMQPMRTSGSFRAKPVEAPSYRPEYLHQKQQLARSVEFAIRRMANEYEYHVDHLLHEFEYEQNLQIQRSNY